MIGVLKRRRPRAAPPPRFRPDPGRDRFLASWPRSGNTWMRAVIFEIECGRPAENLRMLDFAVPDVHDPPATQDLAPRPRYVVKTHDVYRNGTAPALCILRHPVDAIESYARFHAKTAKDPLEPAAFVRDVLLGRIWPGGWSEHVLSWTRDRAPSDTWFGAVRYEDLMAADPEAVGRLAAFLGADAARVRAVLAKTDVAFMRDLEKAGNRPRLERAGAGWFIGGEKDASVKDLIREEIARIRPEIAEVAAAFGYAMRPSADARPGGGA